VRHLRKGLIYIFLAVNAIYMGWRVLYTLPFAYGLWSLSMGGVLLLAELSGFFDSIMFYLAIGRIQRPHQPKTRNQRYPDVDVFIATYNEPVELLYKTINACKGMAYPDRKRVHIYVCDDGHRREMRELAEHFGVHYLSRSDNAHAKAGNLNHALQHSQSPLIATFDADMMPRRFFLMTLVPYFMVNNEMGFIQTPQAFYNPDTFQFNLYAQDHTPNEQDLFFTLVQAGRSTYNAAIYAGSNTLLRRAALEAIGGFVVGTITEDIATGMKIQAKGYESLYHPDVLAVGLTPTSLVDVYNQRIRWANGVLQTFRQENPLTTPGLSLMQRLFYLNSLTYWFYGFERIIFFLAPLMFALLDWVILDTSLTSMLMFWGPFFAINYFAFQFFTQGIRSFTWSNIYEAILAPQIALNLTKELFGLRMSKFNVTPKEALTSQKVKRRYDLVITQIVLLLLSIAGIVRVVWFLPSERFDLYLINLFWLLYNSYVLLMSIFYAQERPILRRYERFALKHTVLIQKEKLKVEMSTHDVSEHGLALSMHRASYFDSMGIYRLRLMDSDRPIRMHVQLVRSFRFADQFIYSFKIVHMAERYRRNWLLHLYDREPVGPRVTTKQNPLKRMIQLLTLQFRVWVFHQRKEIRLPLDRNLVFETLQGPKALRVLDASFKALRVELDAKQAPKQLSVALPGSEAGVNFILDEHLSKLRSHGNKQVSIYQIELFNPDWEQAYLNFLHVAESDDSSIAQKRV
jgi:cellulose synthase (UDP-forming)